MEYNRTKDILHGMRLLRHKPIQNTLIYTQPVSFQDEKYVCKAAETVDEAKELIETGYRVCLRLGILKVLQEEKTQRSRILSVPST